MELLDKLEAALTSFNLPLFLSPHTLQPKYESIISAAQELLIKAESGEGEDILDEDIPALVLASVLSWKYQLISCYRNWRRISL